MLGAVGVVNPLVGCFQVVNPESFFFVLVGFLAPIKYIYILCIYIYIAINIYIYM